MNPYLILGAVAICIACSVGGYFKGRHDQELTQIALIAQQKEISLKAERQLQDRTNKLINDLQYEKGTIISKYNAAIIELRKRSERLPEASRSTLSGTTGAELSRPDAEFLTGEAARADQLRSALNSCYNYIDLLKEKFNGN